MKAKLALAIATSLALVGVLAHAEPQSKGPLEELGLPIYPGAKLVTVANVPQGKLLDTLKKEFGAWLGIERMTEVNIVSYSIDSGIEAQRIFSFYDIPASQQGWKTLVSTVAKDSATAILSNKQKGMLILNVDPPGMKDRQMAVVRIVGKLDSRTMIGNPIPVPPSQSLRITAIKSNIKSRALDQNTVQVRVPLRAGDPGEILRENNELLLALAPKLQVDEIILPGTVPIRLELTEGSFTFTGGPGPDDRPVKLEIYSIGSQVSLESFPLVSGIHTVQAIGGGVEISIASTRTGSLEIEVTGGDLSLALPPNAPVKVDVDVSNGKIENTFPGENTSSNPGRMTFQVGDGKAMINARVVRGNVCIKPAR